MRCKQRVQKVAIKIHCDVMKMWHQPEMKTSIEEPFPKTDHMQYDDLCHGRQQKLMNTEVLTN
jgi:hypothetical protein